MPSHCLNQCWNIVNWILTNKLQWHFKRNSYIWLMKMRLKVSSVKLSVILSRHQCLQCISQCEYPITAKEQSVFERNYFVDNHLLSLLLASSIFHNDTTLCMIGQSAVVKTLIDRRIIEICTIRLNVNDAKAQDNFMNLIAIVMSIRCDNQKYE